jgi:predicted RNA-binding Zn ribbon-like protein
MTREKRATQEEGAGLYAVELCLDFANTAEWHASDHPEEHLNNYADLVSWAQTKRLISASEAKNLNKEAGDHPERAAHTLGQAIELREALYRIFSAQARGRALPQADLGIINRALSDALSKAQIVQTASGFRWGWVSDELALDRMLWPIVRSAADLLTLDRWLARVGQCQDDRGCGWLFLDKSKNHSRQWCDIKDCGNRAKQRRYYRRAKQRADHA